MSDKHRVLWDGECGFCRRAVKWFKRVDTHHQFEFIPYQQVPSPPMTPELYAACAKAVHVIKRDGSVLRGGRAVLFVLEKSRWRAIAQVLMLPPLIWAVELGYRIVAANRPFFARFLFRHE